MKLINRIDLRYFVVVHEHCIYVQELWCGRKSTYFLHFLIALSFSFLSPHVLLRVSDLFGPAYTIMVHERVLAHRETSK